MSSRTKEGDSAGPPAISVVAPLYNEVDNIERLVAELTAALEPTGERYELLLIDDGSDDGSGPLVEELAARFPCVRTSHQHRRGQSAALLAGIRQCRGEVVVTIDADLQNDPADIPRLLSLLTTCDLVAGRRIERADSWLRRIASRLANGIRRLVLDDSFLDIGCSLKAYRAAYLQDLPAFDGLHRFLPAIVEHRGAKVLEVPVNHRPRSAGKSKYGVADRGLRGLRDLLGVHWLLSRSVDRPLPERLAPRDPWDAGADNARIAPMAAEL